MKSFAVLAFIFLYASCPVVGVEIWRLDSTEKIGGHSVTVIGAPRVVEGEGTKALAFDGVKDGVLLPAIPVAGARRFTIEVLFRPAEGGPAEQRFFHAQDAKGSRAMIETRLDGKGGWWLDTFLTNATPGSGVALIDPQRLHPTGRWHWVALRYDGMTMAHFVDGKKELEKATTFAPLAAGQISLGVRQNLVHWFKGVIREVRFHAAAIAEAEMQRVK